MPIRILAALITIILTGSLALAPPAMAQGQTCQNLTTGRTWACGSGTRPIIIQQSAPYGAPYGAPLAPPPYIAPIAPPPVYAPPYAPPVPAYAPPAYAPPAAPAYAPPAAPAYAVPQVAPTPITIVVRVETVSAPTTYTPPSIAIAPTAQPITAPLVVPYGTSPSPASH